jgi:hypothetical protein
MQSERLLARILRYQTASPVTASANGCQPNSRASNSGGPNPRHHICPQLQHLLMTIRVMARPERAYLSAHAARATSGQEPFGTRPRALSASTIRNHPDLRASNSGELPPCHHIRPHKVDHFRFSNHVMCRAPSLKRTIQLQCNLNEGVDLK